MKLRNLSIFTFAILMFFSCNTNPFTGNKTLAIVPNSQLLPMAFKQYDKFLKENEVIKNTEEARMVKHVGQEIANAAEKWLNNNGYKDYLKNYKWEYSLIDSEQVNAFCMPGGKIVVYQGILPIAQDRAGVAGIMGHEVAHALANHGQQRMSAAQIQQTAGAAGSLFFEDEQSRQIFSQAYGLGSQVGVMLPFNRKHETQADKIGLDLMAIAGYDPQEAADLWRRMSKESGGKAPPEFLSTHPSNQTRISNIEKWAPGAKATGRKYGVTNFEK